MNKLAVRSILFSVTAVICMSAACAKEVVVGQSTALTGVLASSGVPMRLGAQICFDMVNANGGVNGERIRFVSRDDNYKVNDTVRNVRDLIEKEGVVVMIGGSGTANNEALLKEKILENARIALVGPRTGGLSLREPFNPYIFHLRPSYAQEVAKAVDHFTSIGLRKIGIIYQDDAFGADGLAAAKAALKKAGLEPAFLTTYARNTTKVEPAVNVALSAAPQGILLLTTTSPTSAILKLFREGGGTAQLIALSVNDADAIIKSVNIQNAHALMITEVFPRQSRTDYPVMKEYHAALKKFAPPNEPPTMASLEGYLAAKIVVEALKIAGPNPTRERIMQSLEKLSNKDLGGFNINFGPNVRAGSSYVDISIINKRGVVIR